MKFSNKTSGMIALIGAPFLFITMCADSKSGVGNTPTGMCDVLYITGWLCCMVGLMNLETIGNKKWGKYLLHLSFIFLSIACIGNILKAMVPNNPYTAKWRTTYNRKSTP